MTITYSFDAERVGRWVLEKAGGSFTTDMTAIGQECDGQLVAGIVYDGYTKASIAMHSRCDDPAKVSRRFYWMIFDYVFNQLNCKRATGIVPSWNTKAQKTNEHLGWKRETTLADYFPDGDAIIYIMRRDDCRWLKLGRKYDGRKIINTRNS
jgi:hypothetical protein